MSWVVMEHNGKEYICANEPLRKFNYYLGTGIVLPKGSIKKLIGRDLTWEDKPVELK